PRRAYGKRHCIPISSLSCFTACAQSGFAPQHVELVSKDKDLGLPRSPRPEQSERRSRSICKDRSSGASISRFAVAVSRFGFAVGTGENATLFTSLRPALPV